MPPSFYDGTVFRFNSRFLFQNTTRKVKFLLFIQCIRPSTARLLSQVGALSITSTSHLSLLTAHGRSHRPCLVTSFRGCWDVVLSGPHLLHPTSESLPLPFFRNCPPHRHPVTVLWTFIISYHPCHSTNAEIHGRCTRLYQLIRTRSISCSMQATALSPSSYYGAPLLGVIY